MGGGNRSGSIDVAATLTAKGQRIDFEVETFIAEVTGTLTASLGRRSGTPNDDNPADYLIAHTRGEGFDGSEDGTGRGIPLVPEVIGPLTAAMGRQNGCTGPEGASAGHLVPVSLRGLSDYGDGLPCLRAEGGDAGGGSEALIAFDPRQSDVLVYGDLTGPLDTCVPGPAIAFSCKDHGADVATEVSPTLRAMGAGDSHANAGGQVAVAQDWAVRRLIVDECARLQGSPDGWTRIPWRGKPAELCPDGPQYKCYGNSMAVPVMRWLAERIQFFSAERAA